MIFNHSTNDELIRHLDVFSLEIPLAPAPTEILSSNSRASSLPFDNDSEQAERVLPSAAVDSNHRKYNERQICFTSLHFSAVSVLSTLVDFQEQLKVFVYISGFKTSLRPWPHTDVTKGIETCMNVHLPEIKTMSHIIFQ